MRQQIVPRGFWGVFLVLSCAAAGCGADNPTEGKGKDMVIKVTTPAFAEGQPIPVKHTGGGADVSPALKWSGIPQGAKSIAIICDDPDAPMGTWVHWVAWNIPADAAELAEGVAKKEELPNGIRQGMNGWPRLGYNGPMPPPGKAHRYYFKIYALDVKLDLKPKATKEKLLEAMKGHVLAEGQLMGTHKR